MQAHASAPEPPDKRQRNVAGAASDVQQLDLVERQLVHYAAHQALAGIHSSKPAIHADNIGEGGGNFRRSPAIAVQ
jgi:hypothetical protein